jgi:hypothetical protein
VISHKSIGVSLIDSQQDIPACLVLQPPKLPIDTQHQILSFSQQVLEASCFGFMDRWLPSLLKERGWSCGAAIELTTGLRIIKKHLKNLPKGCLNTTGQSSFQRLTSIVTQLRHAAVHRLHLTSDQLLKQVHSAHLLAEALQDSGAKDMLGILYVQVDRCVKRMDHDMGVMEQEARRGLLQIKMQRDALRQSELVLQKSIAQQQVDIPSAAGQELIGSIDTIINTQSPNRDGEIKSTVSRDQNVKYTGCNSIVVDEADIESDEDRLRAEL